MDFLLPLLAAFGGGVLAAGWGSIAAFAWTGFLAIAGNTIVAAGGPDTLLGLAFGPLFGPHVSFAAGVAALAYAHKAKIAPADFNVTTPLAQLGNPTVYLVGGIFGVVGHLLLMGVSMALNGALSNFDSIALCVATSGIIVRFVFGSSGLVGKNMSGRKLFPAGNELMVELVLGLGLGILAGYVAFSTGLGSLPFAIAASVLIFLVSGQGVPVTHQIAAPAATAMMASGGNLVFAIIFGLLGALLCNFFGRLVNTDVDTHIDPPACAIATSTLIIALIFG